MRTGYHAGVALLRPLGAAAAASGLFALGACSGVPVANPLVGLHDQAISLSRPSQHENGAGEMMRTEPEVSELQNSR
jgi:hypothetical protein